MRAERHFFKHRGLRLSFLDSCPGDTERPVALLLHGFPDTADMWAEQVDALHAAGYRCIAPDIVGCGESDMAAKVRDYHAVTIAGDHAALLDHLNIPHAHVVGHDWGAIIAWFFAGYFPARTRRLVVMSVGHPTAYGRSGLAQKLAGWYTFYFQLGGIAEYFLKRNGPLSLRRVFRGHPHMDEVMERLSEPGRMTAALRIYRAALVPVLVRKQPHVCADTLGIWSDGDRLLVDAQMKASEKYVDGSWQYQEITGGHWMSLGQPDLINSFLLSHLAVDLK